MSDAANIVGTLHIDRYLPRLKMPYAANADLPETVRGALPDAAQTRFRQVVNESLDRDLSDSQAFASAWSVVRQGWEKTKSGKWVRIKKAGQSLFMQRKLENADQVISWAKAQGFETALPPEDMHVTVAYSKDPVKWPTPATDTLTVYGPSGRSLEQFGDATVLTFDSPTLESRWQSLIDAGASWDHDGYTPHVTLTWKKNGLDLTTIEPYMGPLTFGPEILRAVDPDFSPDQIAEKYNENHDAQGRFASGPGGGGEQTGDIVASPSPSNFTVTSNGSLTGYTAKPASSATELFQRTYNPSMTVAQAVELTGSADRVAEAKAKIAAGGANTKTQNVGPDGKYTVERQALHETMLDEVFTAEAVSAANPTTGMQPTLYVLGGRAGAGKSWFSNSVDSPFDEDHTLNLNSDYFKERLPEYEGWNAKLLHEESSDITERAHKIARESKLNVTFDATLRSTDTITRMISEYKAAGYLVEGYFMHTAPQVSVVRALNRFNKPNPGAPLGPSNRYVPPAYVLSSTGNERVFDSLASQFSKYAVYDNNSGDGPKLVKSS